MSAKELHPSGLSAWTRGAIRSLAAVAALLSAPALAGAGTFYVDSSSPQCSSSGPGTEANPYCTIGAAIAAHNGPGITIVVKSGVYPETITIPSSGVSGNPFVIQAAGTAVIDGADDFTDPAQWHLVSGTEYVATAVTWAPVQVFADGQRLDASTATPGALPENSFEFVSGNGLHVNLGGGNPGLHILEVGHRTRGFTVSGKQWVTIDGFRVQHTEERGIYVSSAASHVRLADNAVLLAGSYGIQVSGGVNDTLSGNTVGNSKDHGIYISTGSSSCVIQDNETYGNARVITRAANGIDVDASSNNLVQRNRAHDNEDTGIQFYHSSNNNLSRRNLSWNNGDHGYDHLSSTGNQHLNDVAYGNYKDGFSIEGNSGGTLLQNCIALNNGLTTNEYDLWVDQGSSSGFVSDYNIFWNSTTQAPIKYISIYTTLAAYQAASGQDAHSKQANALFVSPTTGNFHLLNGSPAIDCGNAGASNWLALDGDGRAAVDIAGVNNTGAGTPLYSDRGVFEYYPAPQHDNSPVVSGPTSVSVGERQMVAVSVTAADPDSEPIQLLTVNLSKLPVPNDAVFVTNSTNTAGTLTWTPPSAGSYQVTFTASNAKSAQKTVSIGVGNADLAPVVDVPASPTATENAPFTLTVNASDPDNQTINSLTADLTGLPPGNNAVFTVNGSKTQGTLTWTPTFDDAPGPYTVTFTASNALTTTAVSSIDVQNVDHAPVVTAPPTATALENGAFSMSVSASDPDGDAIASLTADLSHLPAGNNAAFTSNGSHTGGTLTWTPGFQDAPGPYVVTFIATNALSGSASTSIGVSASDQPPTVTAPATASAAEGALFSLTVTAQDLDGQPIDSLTANLLGLPAGNNAAFSVNPSHTSGTLTWTPGYNDAPGTYNVTFTVKNGQTGSATTAITVSNTDRAPVVTAAATATATENAPFSLDITAADPDGQPVTILTADLSHLPAGNNAVFTANPQKTGGTLTWTPTYADAPGPYLVTFTASNALAGSAQTSISVTNVDRAPIVTAASTVSGSENTPVTITVTATDPDGEAIASLTANTSGLPAGNNASLTVNPAHTSGTFSWTPSYVDGRIAPYTVSFTATNALTGSATSSITIANVDRAPVVTAPATLGGSEATQLTLVITAADPDGQAITSLTADLAAVPPADNPTFTVNPSKTSGTLTWTPNYNAGRAQPYPVTFTASNALSGSAATAITISNVDRAPVVTAPATVTHRENDLLVVTVTAADPDGDPIAGLTADLSALPSGNDASFVSNADHTQGTLTWRPSFTAVGSYPITFRAANARAGTSVTTVSITNLDRAPVVSAPANLTVNENGTVTVNVSASDPDGDPITSLAASLTGLPPGNTAVFTTSPDHTSGTLTWTPSYDDGGVTAYSVFFTAANARSTTIATHIDVLNVDRPPVVAVPTVLNAMESQTLVVHVTASDPDHEPIQSLTADLSTLPAGNNAVFAPGDLSSSSARAPVVATATASSGSRGRATSANPAPAGSSPARHMVLPPDPPVGGGVADPVSYTFTWTPTYSDAPGPYQVTFTALNALSGSTTVSIEVSNQDRAPQVVVQPNATVAENGQLSLLVTADDSDGDAIADLNADLSGLPAGNDAHFDAAPDHRSGTLSWTPGFADAPGPYTVTFTASNALSGSASTAIGVTNVDRAPVVTAPASIEATENVPVSIQVTADDPDGDPVDSLTADLSALPPGNDAAFTAAPDHRSGTLTWTPAYADGPASYNLSFTAWNALSGTASTSVSVANADRAPVVSAAGADTVTERQQVSLTITASDPDGNPIGSLTADLSALPPGNDAVFTPAADKLSGTFTWTPTWSDGPGSYLVRFIAENAVSDTAQVELYVVNVDRAPVVVAPAETTVAEDSLLTLTVAAADSDGDAVDSLTADLSALPPGNDAVFTPAPDHLSGTLTWTPAAGTAGGPYAVTFTAKNAASASTVTSITVSNVVSTAAGKTVALAQKQPPGRLVARAWLEPGSEVRLDARARDLVVRFEPARGTMAGSGAVLAGANGTAHAVAVTPLGDQDGDGIGEFAARFAAEDLVRMLAPADGRAHATLEVDAVGGAVESAELELNVIGGGVSVALGPNPMRRDGTLKFVLPAPGAVRIEAFDITGRRATVLLDESHLAAGLHEIHIDSRRLGPGVYFYRMSSPAGSSGGRFVVLE